MPKSSVVMCGSSREKRSCMIDGPRARGPPRLLIAISLSPRGFSEVKPQEGKPNAYQNEFEVQRDELLRMVRLYVLSVARDNGADPEELALTDRMICDAIRDIEAQRAFRREAGGAAYVN